MWKKKKTLWLITAPYILRISFLLLPKNVVKYLSPHSLLFTESSLKYFILNKEVLWMKILKYETISKVSWQNCLFKVGKEIEQKLNHDLQGCDLTVVHSRCHCKEIFKKQYRKWPHFGALQLHLYRKSQKRKMKCVLGTGINFRNSFIHGYPKHEGLCSLDGWDWRDRIWHTVLDDFRVARLH